MNQCHDTTRDRRQFATTLLIAAVLSGAVWADEIRINGIWYPQVTIETIKDGTVTRVNDAGIQIPTNLKRVGGLKMNAYPQLARAQAAIDSGDLKSAHSLLRNLRTRVRQTWLRDWVTYQRMNVSTDLGEAGDAVDDLLALARNGADPFYFTRPPTKVFDHADANLSKQLSRRLEKALRTSQVASVAAIRAMLAAAEAVADRGAPPVALPIETPNPATAAKSAIALVSALNTEDPITRLLQKGKFQAALEMANQMLAHPSDTLSRRIYQRGMARIGLADRSGAIGLYKSAGLDFMRVLIHYPRSPYRGAALLETAYVHQKIRRADLARKLFDRAKRYIREERDPALAARLHELVKQQPDVHPGG